MSLIYAQKGILNIGTYFAYSKIQRYSLPAIFKYTYLFFSQFVSLVLKITIKLYQAYWILIIIPLKTCFATITIAYAKIIKPARWKLLTQVFLAVRKELKYNSCHEICIEDISSLSLNVT